MCYQVPSWTRQAKKGHQHYNFDISYRAGFRNGDADGLSRYPYHRISEDSTDRIVVGDPTVKAVCGVMTPVYIETLPMATHNITEVLQESGQTLAQNDMREISRAQRNDNIIDIWRCAVIDKSILKNFVVKEDLTIQKQGQHLERSCHY